MILKYASSPHPGAPAREDVDGRMRAPGEKTHRGAWALVGVVGRCLCRLGCAVGLRPPTLNGPCNFLRWTSKFTRTLAKSRLDGGAHAFREMIDYASPLRGFWVFFSDAPAVMIGFKDCGSLFAHLRNKKPIAEQYLARHSLGTQQSLVTAGSDTAYWPPCLENPAKGAPFTIIGTGNLQFGSPSTTQRRFRRRCRRIVVPPPEFPPFRLAALHIYARP